MRRNAIDSTGFVVGSAPGDEIPVPVGTAVAVRLGDWVVGPSGPEARPVEVRLDHSQAFFTPGILTARIILTIT